MQQYGLVQSALHCNMGRGVTPIGAQAKFNARSYAKTGSHVRGVRPLGVPLSKLAPKRAGANVIPANRGSLKSNVFVQSPHRHPGPQGSIILLTARVGKAAIPPASATFSPQTPLQSYTLLHVFRLFLRVLYRFACTCIVVALPIVLCSVIIIPTLYQRNINPGARALPLDVKRQASEVLAARHPCLFLGFSPWSAYHYVAASGLHQMLS